MDKSQEFQLMLNKAIISEPFGFVDFDRTKNVQDQLQEMVGLYVYRFTFQQSWSITEPKTLMWQGDRAIGQWGVMGFSMEQLWLAFAMKEKYNKSWDGKDWIASKENNEVVIKAWVKEGKEPWVSRELTAAEQRAYKELEEENGNT